MREHPEAVEHHHDRKSDHDRQHEAREDDEEGEVLGADAGLHQLQLSLFQLVVLKHLELRQDPADLVGRLVAVGELLALVGRGDDAGFQLLAALVERLDAPRHRILDRGRSIDREHHREGRDGAEHRRDVDDIEAEDGRA